MLDVVAVGIRAAPFRHHWCGSVARRQRLGRRGIGENLLGKPWDVWQEGVVLEDPSIVGPDL